MYDTKQNIVMTYVICCNKNTSKGLAPHQFLFILLLLYENVRVLSHHCRHRIHKARSASYMFNQERNQSDQRVFESNGSICDIFVTIESMISIFFQTLQNRSAPQSMK